MKTREPRLPSSTFVASYLGAFRPSELNRTSATVSIDRLGTDFVTGTHPIHLSTIPGSKPEFPTLPADSMNTGNNTLSIAFDALAAADYQRAFILCNEALDQGISEDWKVGKAEALNMRGTFR